MENKNTFLVRWCGKPWLIATYLLGILVLVVSLFSWKNWEMPRRLMALLAILLPLHVFEENTWPEGFHYMLNTVQKSDRPNAGPMNRLSDMVSNFGGELVFILLWLLGGNLATSILVVLFGIGECIAHTVFGFILHGKLRSRGMKTIYGPGLVTSYLTLLPVSVWAIIWLCSQPVRWASVLGGIALTAGIIIGLIRIPIKVLGRFQPEYEFGSAGYFERFL